MHILLVGAGAWGTALAISAARHPGDHRVSLWAREPAQAQALQAQGENRLYLPGHRLPPGLSVLGGAPALLAAAPSADLLVLATPVSGLRPSLQLLRQRVPPSLPLAWLCKGFEPASADGAGLMPHEILAQEAPHWPGGALSGPSFAQEVAQGLPAALVAAAPSPAVRQALVCAFHSPTLRVYENDDLIGVEVGGAVKNVLAIAAGFADGLGLGLNARAALITRGLAEMARLGVALGGRADTFMGLSGMGDLVLTATGDLSRNRRVGALLAQGQSLAQALAALGHVAEGVRCARTVWQRARQLGVDMPITATVVALLDGQLQPAQAVAALMGRQPADEIRP